MRNQLSQITESNFLKQSLESFNCEHLYHFCFHTILIYLFSKQSSNNFGIWQFSSRKILPLVHILHIEKWSRKEQGSPPLSLQEGDKMLLYVLNVPRDKL